MIKFAIIAYITTFVIEAPLRFVLSGLDLALLIYVRDLLLIAVMLAVLAQHAFKGWLEPAFWLIAGILSFHALIAFYHELSLFQIMFGLKMYLPMLFIALVYSSLQGQLGQLRVPVFILFLLACSGVYINSVVAYPWEGLRYIVAGAEIEGNRQWFTTGIALKRIAGFTRTSFEAAVQVLILGGFLVAFLRAPVLKVVVWLMAGVAIVLTTTKGILLAYLVVTVFLIVKNMVPNVGNWYQKALVVPASILVLMPVFPTLIPISINWFDATQRFLFSSFIARMESTWPGAFGLLNQNASEIVGRGVGGIGTAQKVFEPLLYNPGDNLFVYLYVSFGVFSIGYLLYFMAKLRYLKFQESRADLFIYMVIVSVLIFGLTANVIDSGVLCLFLGMAVAHLINLSRRPLEIRIRTGGVVGHA